MTEPSNSGDVRMRGFARRTTVEDALAWIDSQTAAGPAENVAVVRAAARILIAEVTSKVNVPAFDRSMMDGFALHAADTSGASAYNRLPLAVIGRCLPGNPFPGEVPRGSTVSIMTGAPIPRGVDAVLPVELVEIEGDRIFAQGEVSPGKHIGRIGEDVAAGEAVLPAGRMLRPQDVGILASIGLAEVSVVRRPRVRIVTTGDELLPAGSPPQANKIIDSNGPMLEALVKRDGGEVINPGIVPDRPEEVLAAMRTPAEVVLVSGGSSVGVEDHASALLRKHGNLPIHGLAMRPSSPAGMGLLDGRLVFLLPGNPVSCLCAYDFFAGRAIRGLGGRRPDWPYNRVKVRLRRKIVSTVGRLDYMRVRLVEGRAEPLAISGASVLSSTTRADGFVLVPPDSEGYASDAEVEVFLYD
jgi:molybdopterin molybdotransferase